MGAYSFSNFKTYLKFQMGKRDDVESQDGLNLYETWINAAYKHLATRNTFWGVKRNFYFPQLETTDTTQSTTDATAYVDVPSDALIVRDIYDTTNTQWLKWIPHRAYIKHGDRADTSAEGKPTQWTRRGSYLYLYKTPDATYSLTIYYRKIPALLINNDNTTVLGDEWDEPILLLAAIKGHQWLKEWDDAKLKKEEWVDMVSSLIDIYSQEELARNERIRPDPLWKEGSYD